MNHGQEIHRDSAPDLFMSRRRVLGLAGLTAAGLTASNLIGCRSLPTTLLNQSPQSGPRLGGTLIQGNGGDAPSLDPHQELTVYMMMIVDPCYNGLIYYDSQQNDKIIPELAERWEISPDGKTYTFFLRKGVKFHDGKPFTSADAKFSLDRIRKPPTGMVSPRAGQVQAIDEITAPDDYTLKLMLKYPSASLLNILASGAFPILPKHVLEAKGDMKKDVVCTGPFIFKEYQRGVVANLVKNPDYWNKGRPYLDGLSIKIITSAANMVTSFKAGEIDLPTHSGFTISETQSILKDRPDAVKQTGPGYMYVYVGGNLRRKPFDDIRVRKAIHLALDRQAAIREIGQGEGYVGGFMAPYGAWGPTSDELKSLPGYRAEKEEDLAEARRLLAEAGYPNGFQTTLSVRSPATEVRNADFVIPQLRKIGIDATLKVIDLAAYMDTIRQRADFDLLVHLAAITLDDPDSVFGQMWTAKGGGNYVGVNDPKLEELYTTQQQTMDVAQRRKVVLEMQKTVADSYSASILLWSASRILVSPRVKNWKMGLGLYNNLRYDDVWLEG